MTAAEALSTLLSLSGAFLVLILPVLIIAVLFHQWWVVRELRLIGIPEFSPPILAWDSTTQRRLQMFVLKREYMSHPGVSPDAAKLCNRYRTLILTIWIEMILLGIWLATRHIWFRTVM